MDRIVLFNCFLYKLLTFCYCNRLLVTGVTVAYKMSKYNTGRTPALLIFLVKQKRIVYHGKAITMEAGNESIGLWLKTA